MPDSNKHRKTVWEHLGDLTKMILTAVTVFGIGYKIARPHIDEKIDERFYVNAESARFEKICDIQINNFVQSAEFQVLQSKMIAEYEATKVARYSDSVKFRTLCSYTMLIDEERVHLEIGKMYQDWKQKDEEENE